VTAQSNLVATAPAYLFAAVTAAMSANATAAMRAAVVAHGLDAVAAWTDCRLFFDSATAAALGAGSGTWGQMHSQLEQMIVANNCGKSLFFHFGSVQRYLFCFSLTNVKV
jgi:hypothetical protein